MIPDFTKGSHESASAAVESTYLIGFLHHVTACSEHLLAMSCDCLLCLQHSHLDTAGATLSPSCGDLNHDLSSLSRLSHRGMRASTSIGGPDE